MGAPAFKEQPSAEGVANDNETRAPPRRVVVTFDFGDLGLDARKEEVGRLLARILVRQALRERGFGLPDSE